MEMACGVNSVASDAKKRQSATNDDEEEISDENQKLPDPAVETAKK